MKVIRTEDLKKIYLLGKVKVPALRGVNIEIEEGEFVALMGPSGSGKSTLLNQIGLLDFPTSGKVFIERMDASALSERERAGLRLKKFGFIFQFFSLFMELTALENVMVPGMLAGESVGESKSRAKELLEIVWLGDRLEHKPAELSGGQQQRVAIARALMNEPSILLADEPTANLDSVASMEIIKLFRSLNENRGITIFMVTHEEEYGKLADRIIRLKDGMIDES
jgi:putative ABC transport system ATP-binding protein